MKVNGCRVLVETKGVGFRLVPARCGCAQGFLIDIRQRDVDVDGD